LSVGANTMVSIMLPAELARCSSTKALRDSHLRTLVRVYFDYIFCFLVCRYLWL